MFFKHNLFCDSFHLLRRPDFFFIIFLSMLINEILQNTECIAKNMLVVVVDYKKIIHLFV